MVKETKGDDEASNIEKLPKWYSADGMGGCNQFLWVDRGSKIDWYVDNEGWESDGFDLEKTLFIAQNKDGSNDIQKIRFGKDTNWKWPEKNSVIANYKTGENTAKCQYYKTDVKYCYK